MNSERVVEPCGNLERCGILGLGGRRCRFYDKTTARLESKRATAEEAGIDVADVMPDVSQAYVPPVYMTADGRCEKENDPNIQKDCNHYSPR